MRSNNIDHFLPVVNYLLPFNACYMFVTSFLSATFPGVYGQTIFQQQQLQRQPQKEGISVNS